MQRFETPVERLTREGLQPAFWSNGPGFPYRVHDHPYDKIIVVQAGSIRFGLPMTGQWFLLGVGDRLELPAGTPHEAHVGPAGVECLEAHQMLGTVRAVAHKPAGTW